MNSVGLIAVELQKSEPRVWFCATLNSKLFQYKKALLSQRRPRDAPYI